MIKGNPTKNDTKTINDIVMDLDTLLETIHVKIVNNKPSLIIYFDTLNDGKFYPTSYSITNGMMLENFTFNNNGDKKQHNNIFFSEITQGEIHISQNRENNYRNCELWYKIINYLGEFNKVFSKNEELIDLYSKNFTQKMVRKKLKQYLEVILILTVIQIHF